MHATRKVKLKDLTSNLTCNLCGGYFVDATTIIECLHSFCRSCIVQHLEKTEYCPVCDCQLHSTKPLTSIRSDQMLQEIVYKLVPGLYQNEMTKRRDFYRQNPNSAPTSLVDAGHSNESYITSDDVIHLSLEYYTTDVKFKETTKRYVKCPAAVSISILKKMIQGKYDLNKSVQIDVMYGDRILPDEFLLMDIAYKYSWTQNGSKPLELSYRIRGQHISKTSVESNVKKVITKSKLPSTSTGTPILVKKSSQYIPRKKINGTIMNPNNLLNGNHVKLKTPKSNGHQILKRRNTVPKLNNSESSTTPLLPQIFVNTKDRPRKRKLSLNGDQQSIEMEISDNGSIFIPPPKEKHAKFETNNNNNNIEPEMMITNSSGAEVQLRISENGIISAKSSSGEEKIINGPTAASAARKSPPSTTFDLQQRNLCSPNLNNINNDAPLQMKPFPANFPSQNHSEEDESHEQFLNKMSKLQQQLLMNGSRSKNHTEHKIKQKYDQQQQKPIIKNKSVLKSALTSKDIGNLISKSKTKVKRTSAAAEEGQAKRKSPPSSAGSGPIVISMSSSTSSPPKTNGNGNSQQQQCQLSSAASKKSNQLSKSPTHQQAMKRFQNITSVNGELKFSPIKTGNIGNGIEIIPISSPNKKPPKFFKSRANTLEITPAIPSPSPMNNGNHNNNIELPPIYSSIKLSTTNATTDTIAASSPNSSVTCTMRSKNSIQQQSGITITTATDDVPSSISSSAAAAPIMVPIPLNSYNNTAIPNSYRLPMLEQWPIGYTQQANNTANGNILVPFVTNNFCSMPFHSNPNINNNNGLNMTNAEIIQQHFQQMQRHNSTTCSTTKIDPMSIMSTPAIPFATYSTQQQNANQFNAHIFNQLIHGNSIYQLQQQLQLQNQSAELLSSNNNKNGSSDLMQSAHKKLAPNGNGFPEMTRAENTSNTMKSQQTPKKKPKIDNPAINGISPNSSYKKKSPSNTPKKVKQIRIKNSPVTNKSPTAIHQGVTTTILQIPSVQITPNKNTGEAVAVGEKNSPQAIPIPEQTYFILSNDVNVNDEMEKTVSVPLLLQEKSIKIKDSGSLSNNNNVTEEIKPVKTLESETQPTAEMFSLDSLIPKQDLNENNEHLAKDHDNALDRPDNPTSLHVVVENDNGCETSSVPFEANCNEDKLSQKLAPVSSENLTSISLLVTTSNEDTSNALEHLPAPTPEESIGNSNSSPIINNELDNSNPLVIAVANDNDTQEDEESIPIPSSGNENSAKQLSPNMVSTSTV